MPVYVSLQYYDESVGLFRQTGTADPYHWHFCGNCGHIFLSDLVWDVCYVCDADVDNDAWAFDVRVHRVNDESPSSVRVHGHWEPTQSDQ